MKSGNNWQFINPALCSPELKNMDEVFSALGAAVLKELNGTVNKIHPALIKIGTRMSMKFEGSAYKGAQYEYILLYLSGISGLSSNFMYCPPISKQKIGSLENYPKSSNLVKNLSDFNPYGNQVCSQILFAADTNRKHITKTILEVENAVGGTSPSNNKAKYLWEHTMCNDLKLVEKTYKDINDTSPFCIKTSYLSYGFDNGQSFDIFFNKKMPSTHVNSGGYDYIAIPYYNYTGPWVWEVMIFSQVDDVINFLNNGVMPELSYLCKITSCQNGADKRYFVFHPSTTMPHFEVDNKLGFHLQIENTKNFLQSTMFNIQAKPDHPTKFFFVKEGGSDCYFIQCTDLDMQGIKPTDIFLLSVYGTYRYPNSLMPYDPSNPTPDSLWKKIGTDDSFKLQNIAYRKYISTTREDNMARMTDNIDKATNFKLCIPNSDE